MVDQKGHFEKISSDPSQAQVDQKCHLRIKQLDLFATCLSILDLEERKWKRVLNYGMMISYLA